MSINSSSLTNWLLWSEGFNVDQWQAADDLIHVLAVCVKPFVFFNIYLVGLCYQSSLGENFYFLV